MIARCSGLDFLAYLHSGFIRLPAGLPAGGLRSKLPSGKRSAAEEGLASGYWLGSSLSAVDAVNSASAGGYAGASLASPKAL